MTAAPRGQVLEGVQVGDFVVKDNRRGVPHVLRVTRITACYVMTGVDHAEQAWRRSDGQRKGQHVDSWDRVKVRRPEPGEVDAIARTHRLAGQAHAAHEQINRIRRHEGHPSPETIAAMEEVLRLLATVPPLPAAETTGEVTP